MPEALIIVKGHLIMYGIREVGILGECGEEIPIAEAGTCMLSSSMWFLLTVFSFIPFL